MLQTCSEVNRHTYDMLQAIKQSNATAVLGLLLIFMLHSLLLSTLEYNTVHKMWISLNLLSLPNICVVAIYYSCSICASSWRALYFRDFLRHWLFKQDHASRQTCQCTVPGMGAVSQCYPPDSGWTPTLNFLALQTKNTVGNKTLQYVALGPSAQMTACLKETMPLWTTSNSQLCYSQG